MPDPLSEADRQARAAFKAFSDHYRLGRGARVRPLDLAPRTFERIYSGARDVPPGIARELAAMIRADTDLGRHPDRQDGWATALELWAQDCAERHTARKAEA